MKSSLLSTVALVAFAMVFGVDVKAQGADRIPCVVLWPVRDSKTCCPSAYCPRKSRNNLSVKHNGGTILFCCPKCKGQYAKSPKKFETNANFQLVLTKQAKQIKCPMSGNDCDKSVSLKIANVTVFFSCTNCRAKVAALKGNAQIEAVFGPTTFTKAFRVEPLAN
ncbi:MAG: hypothetical protein ACFCD0_06210 [Gemmataceae bacterium]